MKIISIKCLSSGQVQKVTSDALLFVNENEVTNLIIIFPDDMLNFQKYMITNIDGICGEVYLGNENTVSLPLPINLMQGSLLKIQPYVQNPSTSQRAYWEEVNYPINNTLTGGMLLNLPAVWNDINIWKEL